MAKSLNKVMLIGNLAHTPEVRFTEGGKAVANFSIATNESWTDRDGQKHEEVEWHNIVAWGKLGEICGEYLGHGSRVYVEGKKKTRKYTGRDGTEKTTVEIVINDMVMLGEKKEKAKKDEAPPPPPPNNEETEGAPPAADDDDIPF